ncbi:hypothetical protein GQR58_024263 [Nymphon striatum]|nr:hypothetical protein GQR58_024263 [Nymphon striatum]
MEDSHIILNRVEQYESVMKEEPNQQKSENVIEKIRANFRKVPNIGFFLGGLSAFHYALVGVLAKDAVYKPNLMDGLVAISMAIGIVFITQPEFIFGFGGNESGVVSAKVIGSLLALGSGLSASLVCGVAITFGSLLQLLAIDLDSVVKVAFGMMLCAPFTAVIQFAILQDIPGITTCIGIGFVIVGTFIYNRAVRFHKLLNEALLRLAWKEFLAVLDQQSDYNKGQIEEMNEKIMELCEHLTQNTFTDVLHDRLFETVAQQFGDILDNLRQGNGTLVAFWMSYSDMVELVLKLLRASGEVNYGGAAIVDRNVTAVTRIPQVVMSYMIDAAHWLH